MRRIRIQIVRSFALALACAGLCTGLSLAVTPPAQTTSEPSNGSSSKKEKRPFYRKYLVPGNSLDDQIIEQEKRIEERPDDASLRNDFGNLLAKRKFPHEAAEQYELAAKLDKSNFISYYNLGLVRETEGKIGDAISAYKQSIHRKPGFPPSRFRLGRLYEHEGHAQEAVAEYSEAFRTDPSMRDPKRNPLVIDSDLIYQASLTNYRRDIASAVENDVLYVEESRFKTVPVDRAVSSDEVEPSESPDGAPKDVGPGGPGVPQSTRRPRPMAPGETGGSTVGGPQQRTPGQRPNRMNRAPARPTPAPEVVPAPEPEPPTPQQEPQPPPGQDPNNPETMPDAPQPPDVEPS